MSSSLIIFAAAWLLVLGYTLVFVGYNNLNGKNTSFADALGFKSILNRPGAQIQQTQGLLGTGGGPNTTGRSSGSQVIG